MYKEEIFTYSNMVTVENNVWYISSRNILVSINIDTGRLECAGVVPDTNGKKFVQRFIWNEGQELYILLEEKRKSCCYSIPQKIFSDRTAAWEEKKEQYEKQKKRLNRNLSDISLPEDLSEMQCEWVELDEKRMLTIDSCTGELVILNGGNRKTEKIPIILGEKFEEKNQNIFKKVFEDSAGVIEQKYGLNLKNYIEMYKAGSGDIQETKCVGDEIWKIIK